MLIKFGLPNGAGGQAAAHYGSKLLKYVSDYERQCSVTIRTWSFHEQHRHWIGAEIPTKHEMLFTMYIQDKELFMPYEPMCG